MSESKKVLDLAILAGETLLHNGAEIFRVQETMIRIAKAYGIESFNVYAISNGIFASVNEEGQMHCTDIRHIPLAPVHLGRVAAVNQLSREIETGNYSIGEAVQKLKEIEQIPYTSNGIQILCSAAGSACFCYLFGGSIWDSLAAFLAGSFLYAFLLARPIGGVSKIMKNILGSGLVTLCGLVLFQLGLGENIDKIIIGSIIPLVPGVPLTNSIRDFFNSDYLSGMIRLIDALAIAFCIAIGVGSVLKVWSVLGGIQ